MTNSEYLEKQIVATRMYVSGGDSFVSSAGCAWLHNDGSIHWGLFSFNDPLISLVVQQELNNDNALQIRHVFVGKYLSRIARCSDGHWSIFRVHFNTDVDALPVYGTKLFEVSSEEQTVGVFLENLTPAILDPSDMTVRLRHSMETCQLKTPVRLTPNHKAHLIRGLNLPHAGLSFSSEPSDLYKAASPRHVQLQ